MPGPRPSSNFGILVPLHYPPQGPRAFRRAAPKNLLGGSVWPPKTHPKFHSIFEGLLTTKMEPNASQNEVKIPPKCLLFPSSFSCRFFDRFREAFCSFSEGPDPRFACYLQGFRGVRLFSQSSKKFQKRPPKMIQNDSQNTPDTLQKSIQKRSRKTRRKII